VGPFEATVLGIVQGLTEFLPISSSAHLRIVPAFFHWADPGAAFTAVIQLGTVAALLIYFRHDIVLIVKTWARSLRHKELRSDISAKLGWYAIVGTIPIGLLGIAFSHQITTGARNLWLIGAMLILLGVVLWVADATSKRDRMIGELSWRDALIIGASQCLALIPGSSRSGTTITAGLFLGLTREAAARFSFILSIPAVLASGLYELKDVGKHEAGVAAISWGPTVVAMVVAFVVGYASIAWLLRWLTSHSTFVFSAYRVLMGALVMALLAGHAISNA